MNILEARRRLLGADVYKKTAEGNPISVRSLARIYPGIEMEGWTEQQSTTGAQLLQLEADVAASSDPYYPGYTVTKNGLTATVLEDGGIQITGSDTTENEWNNIIFVTFTKNGQYKLPPGTYTVTDCILRTNVGNKGGTFVIEEEATVLGWHIAYVAGTSNIDDIHYPMLNAGSTALPWEPYTGGQPSPSPDYPQEIVNAGKYNEDTQKWEYEVKVQGKNYLDIGTITFEQAKIFTANIPAGTYTFSAEVVSNDTDSTACLIMLQKNGLQLITFSVVRNSRKSSTFTIKEDADTIILCASSGYNQGYADTATFGDVQLEIGSVATPYEPYRTPQTVTLTADRPLTKWDRLEKRDGQWGWVYKSKEANIKEFTNWYKYTGFTVEGLYCYAGSLNGCAIGFQTSICDKFRNVNTAWNDKIGRKCLYSDHMNSDIKFFVTDIESLELWKTWVSQNDVNFVYETAEEAFIPLTAPEQSALNALHTNYPTTVLMNDQGCEMRLKYKTKKSLEVT